MLVDGSNAFFLKEANLDGLLGPVKRSHKQLQEAARASTGNILTTIQIREALSRDVLVPWRGWRPELFKSARTMSEWSDTQLLFLQAVYNARQLRYDSLEYDLLTDSMIRLQEYVGIETDELQDLLDADVLRHDTDHPHRLYSVTADGRAAIGESYRKGVDYGHGQYDLGESSQHVMTIEVAPRYLEQEYRDDPDSSVVKVVPYYDVDETHRLDPPALNADGEFVVAVEVERITHDVKRAVPADYDKMADCEPEEAIWVVMTQSAGHDVLEAMNDLFDGPVWIDKTYSKTTPPYQFRIDSPGMTAIYPIEWLKDNFLD